MAPTPEETRLLRLLTLVAHELRSPLTVSSGYLKMLESGRLGPLTEAQQKAVAASLRAADQLMALATDLSFLARLHRGEAALARAFMAASELIDAAIQQCPSSPAFPVRFQSTGPDDGPLFVDPVRTRQALKTLLMAAARNVAEEATIAVSCRRVPGKAGGTGEGDRLAIGIAEAGRIDAIGPLEPGQLAEPDEWQSGLGVGLPLARRVIALEGGSLHYVPEHAALLLYLPIAQERSSGGSDARVEG